MLLHARRQGHIVLRLPEVCLRALATKSAHFGSALQEVQYLEKEDSEKGVKDKRFIDKVRIRAWGGLGGGGCDSYIKRSRKGIARPIPDGGHGGPGGDVIVEACSSVRDLQDVRFVQRAGNGAPGGPQKRTGIKGKERIITVPVGTCIARSIDPSEEDFDADDFTDFDAESPSESGISQEAAVKQPAYGDANNMIMADLDTHAARFLIARGGLGGRGSITTSRWEDDARSDAQQGKPGEEVLLQLELKLLADVGFVGVPNVGKSTLLRALTNARPKIANYPFTTLQPQLGILDVDHKQMVLADIPGLIAGASQNRGRGFAFLRHVERTRMLAYVLDLSSGASPGTGPTPLQQLADLQAEVQEYSEALPQKSALIVGNKLDQLDEASSISAEELRAATGLPVHFVSAKHGQGLDALKSALSTLVYSGSCQDL